MSPPFGDNGPGQAPQYSSDSGDSTQGANGISRKRKIVVVGLGMVAVAFIEKMLKLDAKDKKFEIVVIGEEPHLAYNRVGLTSFFEHRKEENLYLNNESWYKEAAGRGLSYHINTKVVEIVPEAKAVITQHGETVSYDILVLATGSNALLPEETPGFNAKGVFSYRTIEDLQRLIEFADSVKGSSGAVIGGGLLGLEAAKAMMDLKTFGSVKLLDRNRWLMSRQLDADAGGLVVDLVNELGVDVQLQRRVKEIEVDENNAVKGIHFQDGDFLECTCVMYAIGILPRDELGRAAGLQCRERGGGIMIGDDLQTSHPGIYAIGECASWNNQTYGLIAPCIEMADVLSYNLTEARPYNARSFTRPDLSTKLKLLGVNVASFGDFFADRDGPRDMVLRRPSVAVDNGRKKKPEPLVKALTFKDPFNAVYKKYIFTPDGKRLLGGMMIGDTSDYIKLVPIVKDKKELEIPPSQFILGARKEGEDEGDDLPDETQICSCHNVTKGDVIEVVKEGTCKSIGEVKSCTKAGTGCGGCMPLVQNIFNKQMLAMGAEISNNLCMHFKYSRADLFNIVAVKKLETFEEIMKAAGSDPESLGCEVCKPTVASILASLYNKHIMSKPLNGLQDTNDKFLANIQRNGTFSVVPRVSGGEIKPEHLIAIGTVAQKYGLYTKITGGQRIDMFGAKKPDLPAIWRALIDAGMESGHAYAKSLRTVKSCVGTTWCRFGVGDSVGMAVRLEERYKSIRAPHKIKGGVSGCVRECAEAQNKDFGLIATDKGFNVYVGGNGGAKPRHSELLAANVPTEDVVPILDRYLMLYIRTADRLQRTARWIEQLPGGIEYLKEVVLQDKLGINAELETQMSALVGSFFCEWTAVLNDDKLMAQFAQFDNTPDRLLNMAEVEDRGQMRPTYWAKEPVKEDFRNTQWSSLSWQPVLESSFFANAANSPAGMSATIKRGDTQLAMFWVRGQLYCTQQMCPHKRSFVLSDGLVGDEVASDGAATDPLDCNSNRKLWVSCPNHKRNFRLNGGSGAGGAGSCTNDDELSIATFQVEQRADGWIYAKLPPVEELDERLGTSKWAVKEGEAESPFVELDRRLKKEEEKGRKARRPNGGTGAVDSMVAVKATPIAVGGAGCGGGAGMDW